MLLEELSNTFLTTFHASNSGDITFVKIHKDLPYREVTPSTPGNKLIFSKIGDGLIYPPFLCWAYLGMLTEDRVSYPYDISDGQTVHIHQDCFSFQTVVRLVLISLGSDGYIIISQDSMSC